MHGTRRPPPPAGLPPPDAEWAAAHRLLAQPSGLDRGIVTQLVGRPARYADLRPLLEGKRDHNLTVALQRLREGGIIDSRVDARKDPPVWSYELTAFGVLVYSRMIALETVRRTASLPPVRLRPKAGKRR